MPTAAYELMVILPPDLTDPELKTKVQDLTSALTQHGGKVFTKEVTPLRDFAYRIGKHDRGFYATFHFSYPQESINELEKTVRIEMGVVRHLLLTCPKNYEFKGLMVYSEEADAKRAKELEEKKAKDQADQDRGMRPRPQARSEKPERDMGKSIPASPAPVAPPVKRVEVPVTENAVKIEKGEPKADLSKVDEQLKAILDNPDIQI